MKNVRMYRGMKGYTQEELAEKIGVHRATVIIAEADNDKPLSKKLTQKLCVEFGIEPYELYGISNLIYKPKTKEELEKFIAIIREEYK